MTSRSREQPMEQPDSLEAARGRPRAQAAQACPGRAACTATRATSATRCAGGSRIHPLPSPGRPLWPRLRSPCCCCCLPACVIVGPPCSIWRGVPSIGGGGSVCGLFGRYPGTAPSSPAQPTPAAPRAAPSALPRSKAALPHARRGWADGGRRLIAEPTLQPAAGIRGPEAAEVTLATMHTTRAGPFRAKPRHAASYRIYT